MILDNLSRAVRTQNWLAAAIEFVIVIAGVVIDFQINAWNEGRRADALLANDPDAADDNGFELIASTRVTQARCSGPP